MKTLANTLTQTLTACDAEMARRLSASMKPGDLNHRGQEALSCALAVIRQLGFSETALVIEEYLTGGKLS